MTAVRGTCLVLALLVLAGCGSGGTKARRDAVNAYIGDVGTAQRSLLSAQGQIDTTLQRFSLTRATPSELASLRSARQEVDGALRRVRTLHPPTDARRLHTLIVQRLALERSVIDELVATAVYVPKIAAVAPPLQAALEALRSDLRTLATPDSSAVVSNGAAVPLDRYAAAFGGYGDALQPVGRRLDALVAPPILRPGLDAERAAVKRSVTLSNAIRDALARRDIPAANAAIHSLFSVSAGLNGTRTQKEQAAAARAYDARLRRVDALGTKIGAERSRLVKLIG